MSTKQFGLTAKLFTVMVAVNILVILAMAVATRVSFERGFLGYVEEQDAQRLRSSIAPLAAAYQEHGSWAFLLQNRTLWHQLVRPFNASSDPAAGSGPLPNLPVADMIGASLRFTLLDTDGTYVFGNPGNFSGSRREPVKVNGKTVGWLVMVPFRKVTATGDLGFRKRQLDAVWTIAVVTILLVAGVTLWLARALASPLRRIAWASRRLAESDYTVRVPEQSGGDIGQLEHDFNHLAQALERSERMRSALVADVSHELRTPLAIMRGEIEALEVGVRPLSAEAVSSIAGEAQRLSRLVDDLYQLSLADVGALRYHHVTLNLVDLLDDMLGHARRRLSDAGIALYTDLPAISLWMKGDELRLQQVFSNIFENATRYVEVGAAVWLRVHQDDVQVCVDIQDSGEGVPGQALGSLFDRFYRVEESRSRATGGAGLGLPICRSIVEAHGGRITAAVAPQGGLWIAIQLPRLWSKP